MTVELRNDGRFQTTRWTLVLAARGSSAESRTALRELCDAYYAPVELFVRRYCGGEDTRDLTHEFFAKLLEGNSLGHLDPTRGRFRSYMLGAVKHFLADLRDRERTLRRGGDRVHQSLDQPRANGDDSNGGFAEIVDPCGFPADAYFDREWAVAVVEHAIQAMHQDAVSTGDVERFEVLKHWLVAPASHDTGLAAARTLNMSDSAFKVAVHRLRKRLREVVKARIADTVSDPAEITDELGYLISALGTSPDS